jgi:SAM-dependent methyltransferase
VALSTGRFERVVAIDPTPSNAQVCRTRGLEVIELPIERIDLSTRPADVVASFEVVEHLFSPRQFIEGCAANLRPGGLLVLSCPNVKGFEVAVLQALSGTVDVEHLNYFHPRSLARLLELCGLEVLELLTPGQLDAEIVRKRALAGLIDLAGQPFLRAVLIEEWDRVAGAFQAFLADQQLSAHMWAVARRPGTAGPQSR